jgi:hypothetical protein
MIDKTTLNLGGGIKIDILAIPSDINEDKRPIL